MTSFDQVMRDFSPGDGNEYKLLGKYQGTVLQNADPLGIGRLMVNVPGVVIPPSTWAMPCAPVAGPQHGSVSIPPLGAGVWVEFEQGELDHPIWVGCYWGSAAEMPPTALLGTPLTPNIVHQTIGQNTITIFGSPGGGIDICAGPFLSPTSPRITLSAAGILLSVSPTCSILMTAAGGVMINGTALVVLPGG
jgi:hypothetical protein